MRKVSRRPRLELRQRQSLTIKQKVKLIIIVSGSIFIAAVVSLFIYMNIGTADDAIAHSTFTWKGNTSDDFSTASNWSPNGVPGSGDKININNGAGSNWPKLYSDVTVEELKMNEGELDLNGYSISASDDADLKNSIISNGTITASKFEELKECTLNSISLTKTGSHDDESEGDNIFTGNAIITNSGSGDWELSTNDGDTYNGDVIFKQLSSGTLSPCDDGTNNFYASLSTVGTMNSITFGKSGGVVALRGTGMQYIYGDIGFSIIIKKLTVNNSGSGVTLNVPARITSSLTLTDGIVYTTALNLLTIGSGISSVSGASDASYVEGPLNKIGNQAFTFPVGKNGKLKNIGMSAPSSSSAQFTAEYFKSDVSLVTGTAKEAALDHISNCEYWTLSRVASSSNVKVTLSWTAVNCGITSLADLKVARWDVSSSRWKSGGTVSTTGNTTAGTITTSSSMSSFGQFTLGSGSSANPLPVELVSFNVEGSVRTAILKWVTASEKDNDYFSVERSSDGKNFEVIGTVGGSGTTSVPISYEYKDANPFLGNSYYRLKQTDFNGQFEYFGPRSFQFTQGGEGFKLSNASPNPFSDRLNINYQNDEEMDAVMKIHRVSGEEIRSVNVRLEKGVSSYTLEHVSTLNPGIYIITLNNSVQVLGSVRVVKK